MTDEERAEDYARGMTVYYESAHNRVPSQLDKYLKNAYLAGLHDDRWHYPSKGDYPKDGEDTLIMFKYKGKKVFSVDKYSQFYNGWMFSPAPIAWMPLPEPPKEEA